MTIAEKNRIMWPEPVEEQMNPEQIALWVERNLDLSKVDYVEFSGSRTQGVWEIERNDDFMAPSEASYARLLEKVKSY